MKSEAGSDREQMTQSNPALSDVECWNAIEKRDIAFDGFFWYGVLGGYRWGLERKRALLEKERMG